jgi:hypothetical protein
VKQTPRSRTASPPLGRAALLAALALALGPSSASAQDPAAVVEAAIPHDSAISEQYQRVQEVLDQAAAAVPDTPLAPPAAESAPAPAPEPPAPPPPPEPAPKPDQYHSENVSVTQQQPSNVNVSIRINSPGDDGPVVQINNAGGSTVVEQVEQIVQQPPAAPEPAAPAGGDLPDTWEWVWTSACFGGAPRAGAATATPGWSWRWSCDEEGGDDNLVSGLGAVPDGVVPDVDELVAAAAPTFAAAPLTAAAVPERPRARPDQRRDRPRRSSATAGGAGPPPAAGGGAPRAGPSPASAHAPPAHAVRPHRDVRAEARARPGDGSASNSPPGGDGPALGASTALGGVAALLLGIWTAVLVTACVIVLPRLRHRRWSGLTWRLTRLPSTRMERPG